MVRQGKYADFVSMSVIRARRAAADYVRLLDPGSGKIRSEGVGGFLSKNRKGGMNLPSL